MVIIRPTADLAKRMKVRLAPLPSSSGGADEVSASSSSPLLGDWYSTDLVLERKQFILAMSSVSRLGVVVDAAPYASFPARLPEAVAEVLLAIGALPEAVAEERARMREHRLAKTCDRSILGSMNEAKYLLAAWAKAHPLYPERRGGTLMPLEMSLRAIDVPSLVMPGTWPAEVTLKALGLPERPQPGSRLRLVR